MKEELQRIHWGVKVGPEQSPILSTPAALLDSLLPLLRVSLRFFSAAPRAFSRRLTL